MRVAITSDTHLGLTPGNAIQKMLRRIAGQKPDVFIHAGDYCGGTVGARSVEVTVRWVRECMPDVPYLSVIGNHDLWCKKDKNEKPSIHDFEANIGLISDVFTRNRVHYLDFDGPIELGGYEFFGNSLWYAHPNPPTNDSNFLFPGFNHARHARAADDLLATTMDRLQPGRERIFVSHFPVIEFRCEAIDSKYNASASFGQHLYKEFGVTRFINGHAHQRHEGPLRWEAGSDYGKPQFLIMELP